MRSRRVLQLTLVLVSFAALSFDANPVGSQTTPTTEASSDSTTENDADPSVEPNYRDTRAGHEEKAGDGLADVHVWELGDRLPEAPSTVRANTRSWIDDCRFDQVSASTIADRVFKGQIDVMPDPRIDGEIVAASDAEYWMVTCTVSVFREFGYGSSRDGYYGHYPVGGRPSLRVIELVRRSAYDSVPLVVFRPEMSPPGTADHAAITQLENWLFVDDAAWAPVSASASIPGLSVTVTATPVRNTWSGFDEPETVVCDVNVPYEPGMTEHPCGAFFTSKDAHTVRLVTDWEAAYVCRPVVAGCSGGRLPSQQTVGEFVPVITSVVPVLTR